MITEIGLQEALLARGTFCQKFFDRKNTIAKFGGASFDRPSVLGDPFQD